VLLSCALPAVRAQAIKDPAQLMPARVLAYAELRQPGAFVKEVVSLFENSALGNVPESLFQFLEEMKSPPPPRGLGEVGGFGLLLAPEVVKEAQRLQGAAAALTGIDDRGEPEFIVVGLPGESQLPRLAFRALLTLERIKPAGTVEGVPLYRPFSQGREREVREVGPAFAMMPEALLIGSPKNVREVIERIKGKSRPAALASEDTFRELSQQLGDAPGLFAYANIPAILDFVRAQSNIGAGEKQALKLITAVRAQAYSLTLDRATLRFREVTLLDPSVKNSFFDVLPAEPVKRTLLHFTPNDPVAALALSNADGAKRWALSLESLDEIFKATGQEQLPSEAVRNLSKATGLDVGKDVLGRITGLAVALGDPGKAPIRRVEEKRGNLKHVSQYPETPAVVVLEAVDEESAGKLVDDVLPTVYGLVRGMKEVKPTTKEVHGQKIATLPMDRHWSLNYGRHGRTIVLGAYAEPVAQALNNGANHKGLLGEDRVATQVKGVETPVLLGVVKPFTLVHSLMGVRASGAISPVEPARDRPERKRAEEAKAPPAEAGPKEDPIEKEFRRVLEKEGLVVVSLSRRKDRLVEELTWTGLKPAVGELTNLALKYWLSDYHAVPRQRGNVSGRVLFRGQPLPTGTVSFFYAEGPVVSGALVQDGTFHLQNAPVGATRVTITVPDKAGAIAIPKQYTDPATTPLTYEVQPGKQQFDIELK
jgi:hypothetical protein